VKSIYLIGKQSASYPHRLSIEITSQQHLSKSRQENMRLDPDRLKKKIDCASFNDTVSTGYVSVTE
jgi:hypothetical protein